MSEELRKKYEDWVVVFADGARFLGKCQTGIQAGSSAVLSPCFQVYHQVHPIQQPGKPPGVVFMPIMFPVDMCSHIDVPLRVVLHTFTALRDMHDDDIRSYDDMVVNCTQQSKDKIKRTREARSGIKLPTTQEVQNLVRKEN